PAERRGAGGAGRPPPPRFTRFTRKHPLMTHAPARVLLIDDHALVRDGMRMRLSLQPELTVVGEADGGEAALAWLAQASAEHMPELVITDIGMRGMGGIALAAALHEDYPELAVLIVV